VAGFLETADMFGDAADGPALEIAPGAYWLRGFARSDAPALLAGVDAIAARAPFRHMVTPGGYRMSVALTCCGDVGWTSERSGYRYAATDPLSGENWPPLPPSFLELAASAARAAGFADFEPDCCLINRYAPGAKLTLHQDRDELDLRAPIVSISLGLPARFLFGGLRRNEGVQRLPLLHGDVVVWGGPARLAYHGVAPVADGEHPLTGRCRINITFRKACS
jgi:alkylated DNA repair protein (DNA oxidative demethylase)